MTFTHTYIPNHQGVDLCYTSWVPGKKKTFGVPGLSPSTSLVAQTVKMWETRVQALDWEDSLKKETQPTPVFLPGEFPGQKNLAGYSPQDHKESDTTEELTLSLLLNNTS